MKAKPKLVVLLGATASGKTQMGIELAKTFGGEVVVADSRTVFRGMNIGTAKPMGKKEQASVVTAERVEEKGIHAARSLSIQDLFSEKPFLVDGIPHCGIDLVNPDEAFTAADFKAYAENHIADIHARGRIPILAGGTGLYISAVVDNLQFTETAKNPALRQALELLTQEELERRLRAADPAAYETIDRANRRRLIRAIEIVETTGKPLAEQQTKGKPRYDILQIGIEVDKAELAERIDARVDGMIADGLVDEVRGLKETYGSTVNAMTGIGYRQICAFLDGYVKLRDAIELIKRDTRQYAKRQLTWFKRDERIQWVKRGEEARTAVEAFLKK